MSADTFLFELYTEEIPSFYQIRAISDWRDKLAKLLKDNLLEFSHVETGGTSRRIYTIIHQLKPVQISERKKIKGPPQELCLKDGQPTSALAGFSKKADVEIQDVRFESWDGKMYATAEINTGGKAIDEILPALFENLIKTQAFVRSMRWGSDSIVYARPVIHYLAQYGTKTLTFNSGIWDKIKPAEKPSGHFILGPAKVDLQNSAQYVEAMGKAGILVNPETRKQKIQQMLTTSAGEDAIIMNTSLLDEVNFLVEKPVVIRGSFPHEFLEMPDIVILSEMEEHQKYFGLMRNASGTGGVDVKSRLSNEFLIVANGDAKDAQALDNIRRGNEKVLRARLSDGSYFFQEDRKKKLIDRVDDLKRMVFHEGMGTVYDKKERIKAIAILLKKEISPALNDAKIARACDLIKADLTTHLVYEFDHLQGNIGSIYAEKDGEDSEVVSAIAEHYLPRNVNDTFPQTQMGILLSIVDKFDNIISGYILGKQPTASQDPLGLRRQTLYIIEMLIQNKINLPLVQTIEKILSVYKSFKFDKTVLVKDIQEFFMGRLATIFEKEGFDRKLINAALGTQSDHIFELYLKLDSLRTLKEDANFLSMMAAFKRMNNIIEDFLAKTSGSDEKSALLKSLKGEVNSALFELPQEKRLYEIAREIKHKSGSTSGIDRKEYEEVFTYLASVKTDVDHFFDNVMVMHQDEKIRLNRLSILHQAVEAVKTLINIEMLY